MRMNITITAINFNYDNGYGKDYTGVNIHFSNSGDTFTLSGYITLTNDQYNEAAGNIESMRTLVKDEIVNRIQKTEA